MLYLSCDKKLLLKKRLVGRDLGWANSVRTHNTRSQRGLPTQRFHAFKARKCVTIFGRSDYGSSRGLLRDSCDNDFHAEIILSTLAFWWTLGELQCSVDSTFRKHDVLSRFHVNRLATSKNTAQRRSSLVLVVLTLVKSDVKGVSHLGVMRCFFTVLVRRWVREMMDTLTVPEVHEEDGSLALRQYFQNWTRRR